MNSTSTDISISIILEMFPDLNIQLHKIKYIDYVHAFFIKFPSIAVLEKEWENVNNAIAFHYQARLENEFEIWNLYLFYVTDKQAGKDIKYRIENDTFSSRKIVLDQSKSVDIEFVEKQLESHITNTDLGNGKQNLIGKNTNFKKDTTLNRLVLNSQMMSNKKLDDKNNRATLLQLKKEIEDEIQKN